jgi:choline dehydrogenase
MTSPTVDYIIVGAGTAGALMANRLSAQADRRVLLLEAGGDDRYVWIHIPVGYLYCIDNPRTDWRYRTEPDAGLNGRSLIYPRGRVLGGCSSINGMIYMRGQSRDYAHWAQVTGDADWSWEQVLPDFIAHEDHHAFEAPGAAPSQRFDPAAVEAARQLQASLPRFHGRGGEWRVERQRLRWEILDAVAEAARQAGIPATPDFNRGNNDGVGYFEVNQRRGLRWNTTRAFLRPVRDRRNLDVATQAHVHRLIVERDADGTPRCVGVELVQDGQRRTVRAAREVILCAGAIGSPQLLQLSGLGPPDLLHHHGITPLADLPGVGANLQDHLQIRAVFTVQGVRTLNTLAHRWWGKAAIALEYALWRTGPMSMAPSQLGIFTRSRSDLPHANIQFHVQPLSLPAFGQPLHDFPAFTASVCNLNPTSRGTVRLRSPRPEDAPAIAPQYLATPEDRQVAADSLRVARRIAAQPALARYQPQEFKPGVAYQSDDDLARLAGDIATTIFHPVGTARMGRADDPLAVVDPHLRVRGVRGLRVVDASVMPTITSGNTNSPTLMIAEKAARWVACGH